MISSLVPLFGALLATNAPAIANEVFPYEVHHHTLDNGLDIYSIPMPTPGVVAYYTWFSVGSRDEIDPGRTGFAHFFEHLAFYGTKTLDREARETLIRRLGAEENAWTWMDETVYHAVLSTEALPRYIASEGDRFQNLYLTPTNIRTEAGAVYGEFRKGMSNPDARLDMALRGAAFLVHPYGHDTIGYEADIAAMPSASSYASGFFRRFYRPEHASVIVAGDVDPLRVSIWIEEAYGAWRPGEEARPQIPQEPAQISPRDVHVSWTSPTAPRIAFAWKIPGHDPDRRDIAALALVDELLLSSVGPLTRRLVDEEGLAYMVGGGREEFVDPCLFTLQIVAKSTDAFPRIEAIVDEELERLISGVDPELLDKTRDHARYAFQTSLDDPDQVAQALGWALRRGGSSDAIDRFFETYDSVGPKDITDVVSTYLVPSRRTRATLATTPPEAP